MPTTFRNIERAREELAHLHIKRVLNHKHWDKRQKPKR